MKIKMACKIVDNYIEVGDRKENFTYLQIGRSWYYCKYIGCECGLGAKCGDAYWKFAEKVSAKTVNQYVEEVNASIAGTGHMDGIRDFVIFED